MRKKAVYSGLCEKERIEKFYFTINITRNLKLKCLTLKSKNFKFASNLREDF